MKKLFLTALIIILAVSMMTACGGGKSGVEKGGDDAGSSSSQPESTTSDSGGGKDSGESAKPAADIIKTSELLTLEDAEKITGMKMEVYTLDEISTGLSEGRIKTIYVTDDENNLSITVELLQEGLIESEGLIELGGIGFQINRSKMYVEKNEEAVPLEGFGDWAYITEIMGTSFHVVVGDYYLTVSSGIKNLMQPITKDQEEALKELFHKAALEGGGLAYERLKAKI